MKKALPLLSALLTALKIRLDITGY